MYEYVHALCCVGCGVGWWPSEIERNLTLNSDTARHYKYILGPGFFSSSVKHHSEAHVINETSTAGSIVSECKIGK